MTVKSIRLLVNAQPTVADGANGMALATLSTYGVYPQTVSGITAGWVANATGIVAGVGISGDAKFGLGQAIVAAGGAAYRIRFDVTAAIPYTVRMQTGLFNSGSGYCTPRLKLYNSDGTTVVYAQSGGNVITDGDSVPAQINSNGSKQTVGAADAGITVTPTGTSLFVELTGAGTFQDRLSYIEWDDGAGGASVAGIMRRRRLAL